MRNVRTVTVFVEIDPSHDVFKGFRIGKNFFTDFAAHLLEEIIQRLPGLAQIVFDAWPSVKQEGSLMKRLVEVAKQNRIAVEMRLQPWCDHNFMKCVPNE